MSSSTAPQQTTTSLETTKTTTSTSTTTTRFVASPETVEATNSTLGLELSLSVSSTIVPSQGAIIVNESLFNTMSKVNNLTASNDWPVRGLTSETPCGATLDTLDNGTLTPEGIAIFLGNYEMNNISNASPILFWQAVECPVSELINFSSFAFLPGNDNGYFGYYAHTNTGSVSKGAFPASMSTGNVTIWATSGTLLFGLNSLGSPSPATYTLVAGDEWGQMVLLHFQVVASNNLPEVGDYVESPSGTASCFYKNGTVTFCTTSFLPGAFVFNCASTANTLSGCTVRTIHYTITVWYPYTNQSNEPSWANCKFSIQGDPGSPYFGDCLMVNSTAFVISHPS